MWRPFIFNVILILLCLNLPSCCLFLIISFLLCSSFSHFSASFWIENLWLHFYLHSSSQLFVFFFMVYLGFELYISCQFCLQMVLAHLPYCVRNFQQHLLFPRPGFYDTLVLQFTIHIITAVCCYYFPMRSHLSFKEFKTEGTFTHMCSFQHSSFLFVDLDSYLLSLC